MEAKEKIALNEENIRQALKDYGRHTTQTEVLNDVSDEFITRLAEDNYYAKQELRELFRKSPVWDEKLDALVINGSRTHDPDYFRIECFAYGILNKSLASADAEQRNNIMCAIRFFCEPAFMDEKERAEAINAIKTLAPHAYHPGKKPTRIFKALCEALGINNETCEGFSWKYAQLADEMTSHKINFKLFVSLNPAHFITMSNPKQDERNDCLTSCHSFNSTEYQYNNGCSGYARDKYTFIVFTVVDPSKEETLNNRKNRRQIFCYKPGNGVLLQSRLYNDAGGTDREQAESKVYRDLIQREISALEEQPNLWRTFKYYGNSEITFETGKGFGGYPDWVYEKFCAKVSIRADCEGNYKEFKIGTYGLCIQCGDITSAGLYCEDCSGYVCDSCGERCHEDELHYVYDRNGYEIQVCESCFEEDYMYCYECGNYHDRHNMTQVRNGQWVCEDCLHNLYCQCNDCGEWDSAGNIYGAISSGGYTVDVCEDCINERYTCCDDCGEYVHIDDLKIVHDENGNRHVCPSCVDNYTECEECDRLFSSDLLIDGLCPDCAEQVSDEENNAEEKIA